VGRLLTKIRKISPLTLENLTYDLLVRKGLRNPRWRTPGADGGRDIEGEFPISDFSGESRMERWYVECKRYDVAIDWPTVFEKIAYARNHSSDYLLMVTTSSISPACRTEVARWNAAGERPFIRDWSGADLERMLSLDQLLLVKYQLTKSQRDREGSAVPILSVLAKSLHQVHGESYATGAVSYATEFASSIAEFASTWFDSEALNAVRSRARFIVDRDAFSWLEFEGQQPSIQWNPYALRAVFATVRFYTQSSTLKVKWNGTGHAQWLEVKLIDAKRSIDMRQTLNLICGMANLEWEKSFDRVTIKNRGR
jgi:hypothetical protein